MTSQARLEANRRNAQKSTGPKSQEGKDAVKFNAVTHGLYAQTIVLPHEDADAYQQRLERWTADVNPRNDMEAYLVARAVKISWQLDRADAHECELLRERFRKQNGETEPLPSVPFLMENLLLVPREAEQRNIPLEDPLNLVRQLEATAEGCRALLDAWTGFWSFLSAQQETPTPDLPDERLAEFHRVTRLLGYGQTEAELLAVMDDDIRALHEIQSLLNEEAARVVGGEPGPGPDPKRLARVYAEAWPRVNRTYQRLTGLLNERERNEANRADHAALAGFDHSAEGERVHRFQDRWSRALGRTLSDIQKVRKLEARDAADETKPTAAEAAPPQPQPQPQPDPEPVPPEPEAEQTEQTQREPQPVSQVHCCDESRIVRKAWMPPVERDPAASVLAAMPVPCRKEGLRKRRRDRRGRRLASS